MGALKIVYRREALSSITKTYDWYTFHMGKGAAQSFIDGILGTVELLSRMPTVGTKDERFSTQKTTYYSFLSHPRYRVVYRYTKRCLYIVAIRATRMK